MTRTVLNGHGRPVVLTPQNCTRDGWPWRESAEGQRWNDMDWPKATFQPSSIFTAFGLGDDPHLRVPHTDGETSHRIRLKRAKITGLVE